ncbi:MAG: hypothetical protein LBQ97_08115 [Fusobacteriaceae bacterium]|jgi:hypothetical protein|nr:hypothetical protein [Fusobacteriaceae bacterium]
MPKEKNTMSKKFMGCMDWHKDKTWYIYDPKKDTYTLTESAPPNAIEAFELYKIVNKKYYE